MLKIAYPNAVNARFKPYKGVSSNKLKNRLKFTQALRFKPYKGVSSNTSLGAYGMSDKSFKPYKGVSSNLCLFVLRSILK